MGKIRLGGRFQLKFHEYHSAPPPWGREDLLRLHEELGGTFPIATTPRRTDVPRIDPLWYNLADGIRAGDAACVELGVRFIEAQFVVSYSGYARARLARALRHAFLTPTQKRRLSNHFYNLLIGQERFDEFTEYIRVWRAIADDAERTRVRTFVEQNLPESSAFRTRLLRVFEGV
ncbi:hypothetical protein [Deinococcus yavapaiensis]|uniref:Uncharacterized protein n=1 Tax=Deinococcus yavapaiensis KR-236 TaxID=694435 RepID=A0A318S190_9DEIO|nr:hypothetical protein [Deinococcus yavapaiensis]PYE48109.1 hypothetical protein DES52_13315 [Deinococcus yavapaiensis KR-236]